ncbi:fused MFS/spermidine synthase [Engelhardtia mirabilis]|uniref:Spermidine synthase n=1 Tax=Engelhardtia mirabilis TaxID=2528011 RepID=A0A518BKP8_9BACT|nr:spermidine synthase [Planctomycetes bacterium Pla133]QDV01880.1 spermidine synthase [Planctomycetes bacterium Pla86]
MNSPADGPGGRAPGQNEYGPGRASSAPPGFVVLTAAAVGGAGVMTVELAAVRLIAPWFGSSLTVWTNVLGTVLAALTLGYLLGARLAAGRRPATWLALALGLGAAFTVALPWACTAVCSYFLPADLALAEASAVLTWGSLAASLSLFLPPAAILGAVGPLAVESIQRRRGGHAGTAGGLVLAVSTLGSLAGTFLTSHLALPSLGVSGTFAVAGLALGAAGLIVGAADRGARIAGAVGALAVFGATGTALLGPDPASEVGAVDPSGRRLLGVLESRYQRVRVVEVPSGEPVRRRLEVNERSDSFQSVWQDQAGLLPYGYYYNDFALPPWWTAAERGATPERWNVLLLGLGAGTAWRVLEGSVPLRTKLVGDGVELDPAVVELAREFLDLPTTDASLAVHAGLDARAALLPLVGPYDQIVLDTYANQVEIPPHLGTVEFFDQLARHLSPGGWLTVNVGAFGLQDPLVDALGATIASAFDSEVLALDVPGARNVTLVARRGAGLPDPAGSFWKSGEPVIDALLAPREVPGATRRFPAGGAAPLTDDRTPLLALQRASLAAAAAHQLPGPAFGRSATAELLGAETTMDLESAREASRVYQGAGSLERAYACASLGLQLQPGDLELELRCAAVALAAGRPRAAAPHLDALDAGLGAVELDATAEQWWRARLEENRGWLSESIAREDARNRATERGRGTALVGLGGLALMGGVLATRRRKV